MNTQILLNGITLQELAAAIATILQAKVATNTQPENGFIPLLKPEGTTNSQSENELMTREEVCKMLSINKTSLWKHTKSGKLLSYGIGNRVLYRRSEVLTAVKPLNK